MNRFVVMHRSAHMPSKCWGVYRRVAVVETDLPGDEEPKMISERAAGVVRIVETWEGLNVGTSERCAFQRALRDAERLAERLNAEAKAEAKKAARRLARRATKIVEIEHAEACTA